MTRLNLHNIARKFLEVFFCLFDRFRVQVYLFYTVLHPLLCIIILQVKFLLKKISEEISHKDIEYSKVRLCENNIYGWTVRNWQYH